MSFLNPQNGILGSRRSCQPKWKQIFSLKLTRKQIFPRKYTKITCYHISITKMVHLFRMLASFAFRKIVIFVYIRKRKWLPRKFSGNLYFSFNPRWGTYSVRPPFHRSDWTRPQGRRQPDRDRAGSRTGSCLGPARENNNISSVANPVPFWPLDPRSGMGKKNRVRIRDEQPGSYFRELGNQFFGVKILKLFNADPGWKKFGSGMKKIRTCLCST